MGNNEYHTYNCINMRIIHQNEKGYADRFLSKRIFEQFIPFYISAVREDRMPGGRNSGAVYNLYKVYFKKIHSISLTTNNKKICSISNNKKIPSILLTTSNKQKQKIECLFEMKYILFGE